MKTSGNSFKIGLFFAAVLIPMAASAEESNDQERGRLSKPGIPVTVTNTAKNAVPVKVVSIPRQSITHLNVGVRELVSLQSMCVPADNSLTNRFFYDRQFGQPIAIPEGYSFVVTDIIADPDCSSGGGPNDFYGALVEGPQAVRTFTIRFRGDTTQHYALAGGLVFTSGNEPHPRNTALSAHALEIQILGYFVKGDALDPGEPRF